MMRLRGVLQETLAFNQERDKKIARDPPVEKAQVEINSRENFEKDYDEDEEDGSDLLDVLIAKP